MYTNVVSKYVPCLVQMAAALIHIHSKGMVHLDIKPDNIYTNPDTSYKLGDFGLATVRSGQWRVQEGDARYAIYQAIV
jgi:serine/threonine protein kinase